MDFVGYAILLTTSFLASIIGGMMGMAMLILPPVMIFLGVPIHTAIATAQGVLPRLRRRRHDRVVRRSVPPGPHP